MRIAIDMQGAQSESRYRGVGRYSLKFVQALIENCADHEIILILNDAFPETVGEIRASFGHLLPKENICVWKCPKRVRQNNPSNLWRARAAELIREAYIESISPDFIHLTSLYEGYVDDAVTSVGELCYAIPTSVTFYDLIPLLNADQYLQTAPVFSQYYLRKLNQMRRANLLLAISAASRREALAVPGTRPDSVVNISAAAGEEFRPMPIKTDLRRRILKKFRIERPFILYAGGADERKNLPRLIQAYATLPANLRQAHQLVLAGRIPEGAAVQLRQCAAENNLSGDDLILAGYISDEDLALLCNLCRSFILPSWHEGFGLPALEAMACGAPVIGSNTSSIPEVIGRDDALFDPFHVKSISEKLEEVLTQEAFRTVLGNHGIKQAAKFSWNATARRAWSAIERIANDQRGESGVDGVETKSEIHNLYNKLISRLADVSVESDETNDQDLIDCARNIAANKLTFAMHRKPVPLPERLSWRIEGPFDSSYSLAIINREISRALTTLGHDVALHSTDGPGNREPDPTFLDNNHDIQDMNDAARISTQQDADILSRNLYPPRVSDMRGNLNLLHSYAWEESGFPLEWVRQFNTSLDGITCLSRHVEKILIDNGVTVPLAISGCGIDHWERIEPDKNYTVPGKSFKFLHVSSCFPRKGVHPLLDAYVRTFSSEDLVTLIIKTFPNPHNDVREYVEELVEKSNCCPDIVILEEDIDDSKLKALYEGCDVFVAPTFAEGFGLPLAEALLSGMPVISTAWGGQMDFMRKDFGWLIDYDFERADTHFNLHVSAWAKPRVEQLEQVLMEAYQENSQKRAERTCKARKYLLRAHRWEHVAKNLEYAARRWSHRELLSSPRIGWVSTWNVRCGIAGYSRHLISNLPEGVALLAAKSNFTVAEDSPAVIRCWQSGGDDHLLDLSNQAEALELDVIVIQFNYGFFDLEHFSRFLQQQRDRGRILIVCMHSTSDPPNRPEKRLKKLQPALGLCDRILVHSISDLNNLKLLGLEENVTLFPQGIPKTEWSLKAEQETNAGPWRIASYGFFLPHKGLLELIDAIYLLRQRGIEIDLELLNAEYPIEQSKTLIETAKNRAEELKLTDYIWFETSFLPDEQCIPRLAKADLIVFPYQTTNESSSSAVRYGIATGRPVAVTPLRIFEDVSPAVYKLPGAEPERIAEGIQALLKAIVNRSPEIIRQRERSQQWCEEHYYPNVAERLWGTICALHRRNEEFRKEAKSSAAVSKKSGVNPFSPNKRPSLRHRPGIDQPLFPPEKDLDRLRYLENVIDAEIGIERGPLSEKQVAVYAPSKTGTTAIYHAIRDCLAPKRGWKAPEQFLLHNHNRRLLIDSVRTTGGLERGDLTEENLMKDLVSFKTQKGEPFHIVSSFRDPVEKAISMAFHHIQHDLIDLRKFDLEQISPGLCYRYMLDELHQSMVACHSLEEIREDFFDKHEFNHASKCCHAVEGTTDILVLSLEHANHWVDALQRHFGCSNVHIPNANATRDKKIGSLYERFKAQLDLPESVVREVYFGDHPLARQLSWFCTKKEVRELFHKACANYVK